MLHCAALLIYDVGIYITGKIMENCQALCFIRLQLSQMGYKLPSHKRVSTNNMQICTTYVSQVEMKQVHSKLFIRIHVPMVYWISIL